jgi:hypothetical protein
MRYQALLTESRGWQECSVVDMAILKNQVSSSLESKDASTDLCLHHDRCPAECHLVAFHLHCRGVDHVLVVHVSSSPDSGNQMAIWSLAKETKRRQQ